jgi:hypothetical protein
VFGPEKLIEWVSRSDESKGYFQSQFGKVFGRPLDDVWAEWVEWEHQFQRANLEQLREYSITEHRDISLRSLGSVSRSHYDSARGEIYSAVNYPGEFAHIAAIDVNTGRLRKVCDVKGPMLLSVTSLAYDPSTGTAFYTTDNYDWRDIVKVDIVSGETTMLLEDCRIGDLVFNPVDKSLWGIRHFNAISTLVRIPFPYQEWNQIHSWPYGKDIYDIDISRDGSRLTASLAEISGQQSLIAMEVEALLKGDSVYVTLYDFGNSSPMNFVHSDDNRYLYGSSYYTGVSNVFRYDFKLDSMECLSNCETGYFRPNQISEDSLVVFRFSGEGFLPTKIAIQPLEDVNAIDFLGQRVIESFPVLENWKLGSPADINIDSLTTYSGAYRPLSHLGLMSFYPIVEGYKEYPAYGGQFDFSTPIGMHSASLTASYSPNHRLPENERLHARFDYEYDPWNFSATYNGADFYDLFGPTKTSRKGYSASLGYHHTLIMDDPKRLEYRVGISGYGGLERLPDYQNISSSFDKLLALNGTMSYRNTKFSIGAVEYEGGVTWKMISMNNYVNGMLFPQVVTAFDFGFQLPLPHAPVWVRSAVGYSPGPRNEPFANFFFGGFGNNWVDWQAEKRYRKYYSFPGVELNEINGTNFGKLLVEWTLPPIRFRRLGFPAFYATWIRTALFGTALATNVETDNRRSELFNLGSQIDVRLQLLSHLRLTLSAGYALAFEEGKRPSDEFMFSVKLL